MFRHSESSTPKLIIVNTINFNWIVFCLQMENYEATFSDFTRTFLNFYLQLALHALVLQ